MISLKNGILRVETENSILDYLTDGCFILLLCSVFAHNSTTGSDTLWYQVLFFAFFGLTAIRVFLSSLNNGRLFLPLNTIWMLLFVLLSVTSILWALAPEYCTVQLSRMIQCLVIGFCISQNYCSRKGFHKGLTLMMISSLYAFFYIFAKTPVDEWFEGQLGSVATSQNSNTVALIFSVCCVIAFFLAYYEGKKHYYIVAAAEFFLVILTSSRKSILCAAFGFMLLLFLNFERKRYFLRIFTVIVFAIAVTVLIMENEVLYNAVGKRFVSMFDYFGGNKVADYSIFFRQRLIATSREIFYKHPLIGIGANNFACYLGTLYDRSIYAHNNYYEVLANLGSVGIVTYYWFYAYLLVHLTRITRSGDRLGLLALVLLLLTAISDYGVVSYYSRFVHILLAFLFVFVASAATTAPPVSDEAEQAA